MNEMNKMYERAPMSELEMVWISWQREESFESFAQRFGFERWMYEEDNQDVGTLGEDHD
jgi:hypothetical protein